jgi:urease accessory protein
MLAVSLIAGNVFAERSMSEKYRRAKASGTCERLLVFRAEMERLRLRRMTDRGTDVGLVLEPGTRLHHGDVLAAEKFIIVEQLPEKVMSIRIKNDNLGKMVNLAALIGHTIGNRHRPIGVDFCTISFPIQGESEIDTFIKLLPTGIGLKITDQVFLPAGEAHVHE